MKKIVLALATLAILLFVYLALVAASAIAQNPPVDNWVQIIAAVMTGIALFFRKYLSKELKTVFEWTAFAAPSLILILKNFN